MIESLDEVMSGARCNVHGDLDIQLAMHIDGTARCLLHQQGDMPHDPEVTIVLDAYQIAHLARVFIAMVDAGNPEQNRVAPPIAGGYT